MNDDDQPPPGMDPEILAAALAKAPADEEETGLGCDAYALWAAMTRLGHEVKLQGRAFAALRERLESNPGAEPTDGGGIEERTAAAARQALAAFHEHAREAERRSEAARRRAERAEEDLLAALADVHDRLARGLEIARRRLPRAKPARGWIGRLLSREPVPGNAFASLLEGQELALRRVADELALRGMREIPALGHAFDPGTMRAVAVDSSGMEAEGTVTEVVRAGWMRGEAVWRAAEVAVAKDMEETNA